MVILKVILVIAVALAFGTFCIFLFALLLKGAYFALKAVTEQKTEPVPEDEFLMVRMNPLNRLLYPNTLNEVGLDYRRKAFKYFLISTSIAAFTVIVAKIIGFLLPT